MGQLIEDDVILTVVKRIEHALNQQVAEAVTAGNLIEAQQCNDVSARVFLRQLKSELESQNAQPK